jgi:hypothetical protein
VRKESEKVFGKDQLEYSVAEKLQPLIVKMMTLRLMAKARMG